MDFPCGELGVGEGHSGHGLARVLRARLLSSENLSTWSFQLLRRVQGNYLLSVLAELSVQSSIFPIGKVGFHNGGGLSPCVGEGWWAFRWNKKKKKNISALPCSFLNVNEDADDMFDDLFNKHGKVVFRRNDQKSPIAEVDDDAEGLSFAVAMAKIASEVKAADIRVLFVKPLVYWTRFFIVITAFSRPQIDAIKTKMGDLAEKKFGRTASGDSKPNSWTLLDYGDVVVHIFLPQQRTFYNLEEFYGNATPIELPFEDQQPFRY